MKDRIGEHESDIRRILDQERVEREVRLAEMEVKKAQNMLDYRDHIFSRPKREWFISKNMKKKINDDAKNAMETQDMAIINKQAAPKKKLKRY